MKRSGIATIVVALLLFAIAPARATTFVINEYVANHTGTDTNEYVEIYYQSPNYDLSGYYILQIEGDGSGAGVVDGAYPVGTTDANGYWMTGYMNNRIENGTMTLLLVYAFTGNVGDDLDTDNDGVLDLNPWFEGRVYDAVAVSDGGASDHAYANVVLTPTYDGGSFTVGGASRIPDHTDTNATADWVRNDFYGRGIPGFTGSPVTGEALNTPGAENALFIPPPDPVINEFVSNHVGADDHEFVEIFGDPDTDYSHLKVIAVDGDGTEAGKIDAIFDIGTTDAAGFWVTPFLSNVLENGTQTLLLGEGFSGFIGKDLDTDNDGVLDTNPFSRTVDGVAVSDNDAGDQTYASVVLTPGFDGNPPDVGGASRIPNGTDTDAVADWWRNDYDGDGLPGFTGTPYITEARNTPGTTNLTAIDMQPPTISIEPSRTTLWPPNHRLTEICMTVDVMDEREPAPTYVLTSIVSNEPADGIGDGHTPVDIYWADIGTGDLCFSLRAERAGGGNGRVYTIVYTATDGAGNTMSASTDVTVPHDQSGMAMSSTGFTPDGTSFLPGAQTFSVIIPSRPRSAGFENGALVVDDGLDAAAIDPRLVFVGNAVGTLRPDQTLVQDMNGDGLGDLVLFYPVDASLALDPRHVGKDGDAALLIHFESPDGADFLTRTIFELGAPVLAGGTGGGEFADAASVEAPRRASLAIQPNPFNPITTVAIEMKAAGRAQVRVFDVRGALVRTLQNGTLPAGAHNLVWDGHDDGGRPVASGIYFVRFDADGVRMTKRAVLLK